MEFYVGLNLKANRDLELELDTEHLLLLTCLLNKQKIKQYQNESICENGQIYFWLSPKHVGENLPILTYFCKTERAKIDKIRGMYKRLIDMGFMEAYPKNQEIAKAYYTFTEKSSLLLTEKNVSPYEKSSKPLTEKAVSPYEKSSKPLTEKAVTISITNDDNTNSNNTSNEGELPPTENNDFVDFDVWGKEFEIPVKEKEKKEKSSAKKEKKVSENKPLQECYSKEDFCSMWELRLSKNEKLAIEFREIDPEKLYDSMLNWSINKGGVSKDWYLRGIDWVRKDFNKKGLAKSVADSQNNKIQNFIDRHSKERPKVY